MREVDRYNITDPEVGKCPFPYYAAMRREEPVHLDPGSGYYWVADYDSVLKAAFDAETFSSKSDVVLKKTFQPRAQALWDAAGMKALDTLVTSDPPEHADYRSVGLALFNPKTVERMAPHIEALVNELIDAFVDRGEVDFLHEFAARLPGTVIGDEFNLPRTDQPRFKTWTDAMIGLLSPGLSEEREVELVGLMIELFRYLEVHLQRAAENPDGRAIHALATMNKRDGTPFSALERGWLTLVTFVGGNETTMNMLTASLRKLALNPQLQDELRGNSEKISAFVEEMLRLEGSVQALLRVATREVEVGGVLIPKGANVVLCTGSANRDEGHWPDAEQFRLDRENGQHHFTFGRGRHVCVGMHLARRELNIAIRAILDRLHNIRLAVPESEIVQVPLPFHRAIANLPLRFDAVAKR